MALAPSSVYDFTVLDIDQQRRSLADYKQQVLLIVNTASLCGFTRQYEELQQLQQRYHARGFNVLAFPCDQFGNQEPGDSDEIRTFCQTRFNISFPLFGKIDVNGADTEPLFAYLKQQAPGVLGSLAVKWNFTKFLVDRSGKVLRRYAPMTTPGKITADIEALL